MAKRKRRTRSRSSYNSSQSGGGGLSTLILFALIVALIVWLVSGNRAASSPRDGQNQNIGDLLGGLLPGWQTPAYNSYDAGSMFYYDVNSYAQMGSGYDNAGYSFGYTPSWGI